MADRRLSAEDIHLWRKVAATVRAIDGRPAPVAPAGGRTAAVTNTVPHPPHPVAQSTIRTAQQPRAPSRVSPSDTLDANWDRKLSRGLVRPDRVIDLHGFGLSDAHRRLNVALADAALAGDRLILLVTGRPQRDNPRLPPTSRGVIRASIGDWLAGSPSAARIAAIRPAHPRHGGNGALYVVLRRNR